MTFLRRVEMPTTRSVRVSVRVEVNLGTRDGVFWDEYGTINLAMNFGCSVLHHRRSACYICTANGVDGERIVMVEREYSSEPRTDPLTRAALVSLPSTTLTSTYERFQFTESQSLFFV